MSPLRRGIMLSSITQTKLWSPLMKDMFYTPSPSFPPQYPPGAITGSMKIAPTVDVCLFACRKIVPTADVCLLACRKIVPTVDVCLFACRKIVPTVDVCLFACRKIVPTVDVGDQIIRVNGFPLEDAIHKEVLQLIQNQNQLSLKVRTVGMIPVKE
uniref:PDZ domain-containing protein n=1 Tax=Timema bartmani TaxID=61472 RepID=A0A7R9I145_9NEOP|nr:unnamed protein product [Timema bartmani]